MKFMKLNPTNDVELGIYEEAMGFIFSDSDIQNVAISGAYGAGKSSILESYELKLKKLEDNKKFLHISLARFENTEDGDTKCANLEGKILNQLLHKIATEKIPLTSFKRKKATNKAEITRMTACTMCLFIISLYLLFYQQWKILVGEFKDVSLRFTLAPRFKMILIMVAIGMVTYFVRYIIRIQMDKRIFRKISFQGNEIEMFNEEGDSYFDKYLNEVIYLFDNSDADVIVFEDMDRYNDVMIFERLREINHLINFERREKGENPIRFFYVLRDDIFSTKDRTKFFDFILPVVPVIDCSNSFSELKKILQEEIDKKIIDIKFLQDISLYINDMRVLKNICNEFFIYNAHINETELGGNKLFAMITYKNVFPKDYSDLQLGKGYIYTVLSNKKQIIQSMATVIDKRIEQIDNEFQKAEREVLEDRQEIGTVIAKRYFPNRSTSWIDSSDLVQWIENQNNRNAHVELHQRLENIELKQNQCKEKLLEEKRKLLEERQSLSKRTLHELITKENENNVFMVVYKDANGETYCYEEVKGSDYFPLLKNLIWNGYIDESYHDYMTYFYEGEMQKSDKAFIRGVADHRAKEYGYSLQNSHVIMEHLRNCDFYQEEILNYDLAEYVLRGEKKELKKQRDGLIRQIKDKQKYDFLIGLLNTKHDLGRDTVKCVCEIWPECFSQMLGVSNISAEFLWRWATDIVCFVSADDLMKVNRDKVLSIYLSNEKRVLRVEEACYASFVENATVIELKVADLQVYEKNNPVKNLIIENRFFQLHMPNINYILQNIYEEKNVSELNEKNYTVLRRHKGGTLYQYIAENMESYVYSYIGTVPKIRDDSDAVLAILNDPTVLENTKRNYISKLVTPLDKLENIQCEEIWNTLMENGLILHTEDNLLYYFERKGFSRHLVTYINEFMNPIDFRNRFQEKDDVKNKLFACVILDRALNLDKYEQILGTLGYHYSTFSIQEIEYKRMRILIKNRILLMNEEILTFLRENYEENMEEYLLADVETYFSIAEKTEIPENELRILFEQYESLPSIIQAHVVELGYNHWDVLMKEKKAVSKSLAIQLLEQTGLTQEEKDDLLTIVISNGTKEEAEQCLGKYGRSEFCKLFDVRFRPRYIISPENKKMLQALVERGVISSFQEDTEHMYYRIRRT